MEVSMLYERRGNLHIHTTLSDGTGTHAEVARAARRAGLDWLIITDHNAMALTEQAWRDGVLLLVGQELHDPAQPLRNHLLVFGADRDLAASASDLGVAMAQAHAAGGQCFVAHPYEHSGAFTDEPEINWERWDLVGQAQGIELWNYMSEFKARLPNALAAMLLALWPKLGIRGPFSETLAKWDELLAQGPCVGLGGSDAHAGEYSLGPVRRRLFSYEHLFRAVNTHALVEGEWAGESAADGARVLAALAAGRCYVAYDALRDAAGFGFELRTLAGITCHMGGAALSQPGAQFVVRAPARARLELLRDGKPIAAMPGRELVHRVTQPGVYRAVASRRYAGRWRTWIIANPIRVLPG
jgi:hypothetical protein